MQKVPEVLDDVEQWVMALPLPALDQGRQTARAEDRLWGQGHMPTAQAQADWALLSALSTLVPREYRARR